jgi:hypothetical protein
VARGSTRSICTHEPIGIGQEDRRDGNVAHSSALGLSPLEVSRKTRRGRNSAISGKWRRHRGGLASQHGDGGLGMRREEGSDAV